MKFAKHLNKIMPSHQLVPEFLTKDSFFKTISLCSRQAKEIELKYQSKIKFSFFYYYLNNAFQLKATTQRNFFPNYTISSLFFFLSNSRVFKDDAEKSLELLIWSFLKYLMCTSMMTFCENCVQEVRLYFSGERRDMKAKRPGSL